MITPLIEQLIIRGIAKYDTFCFGGAATGAIPVDRDEVLIITSFDYWHFVDAVAQSPGSFAISNSKFEMVIPDQQFIIGWTLSGQPTPPVFVTFDPFDIPLTNTRFQNFLNANFPGFTCSITLVGNEWSVVVRTTIPGNAYNTLVPDLQSDESFLSNLPGAFAGGTAPTPPLSEQYKAGATHKLTLSSKAARYLFTVREQTDILALTGGGYYANTKGYYHCDTYCVFTENVDINISRVPLPNTWTGSTYNKLPNNTGQKPVPAGYGSELQPTALKSLYLIQMSVGETYYPLSFNITGVNSGTMEQFDPNTNNRALYNPTESDGVGGNTPNYPLINFTCVRIKSKDFEALKGNA